MRLAGTGNAGTVAIPASVESAADTAAAFCVEQGVAQLLILSLGELAVSEN